MRWIQMRTMSKCLACLAPGLFIALSAHANLTNIPLDYLVSYTTPPPEFPQLPGQGGHFTTIKNDLGYDGPTWENDGFSLHVDNNFAASRIKDVWLEINYAAGMGPAIAPNIALNSAGSVIMYPPERGADDWTFHWLIVPQPASETFKFPDSHYFQLQNPIQSFEFGTRCVPEPVGVFAGLLIVLPCVARRRIRGG